MRELWNICLVILINFKLITSSFNVESVQTAKARLQQLFPRAIPNALPRGVSTQGAFNPNGMRTTIPDGMAEWLAVLDDSINIMLCFPTIKDGPSCYKSRTCKLPQLKFGGKMLPFILRFCKDPYKIGIHFLRFKLPWYVKVKLEPLIIEFKNDENDGVFSIKSYTKMYARLALFGTRLASASLSIDGILRYDCTKPTNDWMTRVRYNLKAPNRKYTSVFYKLKIRIEVKKRRWRWFSLSWRCIRCEDVVNESGSYGEGRASCAADMRRYHDRRSYGGFGGQYYRYLGHYRKHNNRYLEHKHNRQHGRHHDLVDDIRHL